VSDIPLQDDQRENDRALRLLRRSDCCLPESRIAELRRGRHRVRGEARSVALDDAGRRSRGSLRSNAMKKKKQPLRLQPGAVRQLADVDLATVSGGGGLPRPIGPTIPPDDPP
jgi:hypothetical protein